MNTIVVRALCLYACVMCAAQEKLQESEKSKKYDNGNVAKRKPAEKPSYKSRDDIPQDYLDYLKNKHGMIDYDEYDYDYYDTYTPTETYEVAKTDVKKQTHAKTDVKKQTHAKTDVKKQTHEKTDVAKSSDTTNLQNETDSLQSKSVMETTHGENLTDSNDTCKLCELHDEDREMRINSIKETILSKIGFSNSNLPNMTGKRIPRIPSLDRLLEQYEMQGDAPYGYHDDPLPEDEYYGQIHKAYTISQTPPDHMEVDVPGGCYFDLPESVTSRRIQEASLWVYIEPPKHHNVKRVVEIFVYMVPTKQKSQGVLSGPRRYKKTSSHGWEKFPVSHIVHHWAKHPHSNRGFVIQAIDKHGRNLAVSPAEDESETFRPMLEMSTTDREKHHRSKRSYSNICSESERIDTCCRYPLRVDFVQFGWDWVIAPTGYVANYCSGECRYRHMDNNPQAYIIQQTPNGNGPCCTPSKMLPLAMLYFDHTQTILYTYMQKMVVIRCGCA